MSSTPALLDNTKQTAHTEHASSAVLSAIIAATLGLILIYAAGFSDIAPLHNAAHDGRHSASFPCH